MKIMFSLLLVVSLVIISMMSSNYSYASNTANWTLSYDQCNKFIDRESVDDIQNLWENMCVFIVWTNWDFIVLSKDANNYWFNLISEDLLKQLQSKYYRGENIQIYYQWFWIIKDTDLSFSITESTTISTLDNWYTIELLQDTEISDTDIYTHVKQQCDFVSYIASCSDISYNELIVRIDTVINTLLMKKDILLSSNATILKAEISKMQLITSKLSDLQFEYNAQEKLLFTIEYIIYKINVQSRIIQNQIDDVQFRSFLKKQSIYFKDKVLLWDLYISQSDQFTFFYYWPIRVNTLPTDTSHFEDNVIENDTNLLTDSTYLKKKIRDKYSATYVEISNNSLMLITKTYESYNKYLLFDTNTLKLHVLNWDIIQIDIWKKWYYMLTQNKKWEQNFVLYNWKSVQNILEQSDWYTINSFELLIWKKVKVFYTLDNWDTAEEIIDISEF